MSRWEIFSRYPLSKKINTLFKDGKFVVSIRYYGYKINLYQFGNDFVEVFINHKQAEIVKIEKLDTQHTRMKFYCDQIKIRY
jgi:hypothetical protein